MNEQVCFLADGAPDGECANMTSALTLVTNLTKGNKLGVEVKDLAESGRERLTEALATLLHLCCRPHDSDTQESGFVLKQVSAHAEVSGVSVDETVSRRSQLLSVFTFIAARSPQVCEAQIQSMKNQQCIFDAARAVPAAGGHRSQTTPTHCPQHNSKR